MESCEKALSRFHTPPVEHPRVLPVDALPIAVRGRGDGVHLLFAFAVEEDVEGAEAEGPLGWWVSFYAALSQARGKGVGKEEEGRGKGRRRVEEELTLP